MPTLFRLLTTLLVLAALVGAAVYYLANYIEPRTREMTVRIPADRLEPRPLASAGAPAGEETATPASTAAQ